MEKVRDFRQTELDRATVELSAARKRLSDAQGLLEAAVVRDQDARGRRQSLADGGAASITDWTVLTAWIEASQAAVVREKMLVAEAEALVGRCQAKMFAARTNVERIELLVERYRVDMQKAETNAERKLEDELAARAASVR